MMDTIYKLVTIDNYELVADYLNISYGETKARVGQHASWVDSSDNTPPQWISWIVRVTEKYITVTDGFLANRIAARANRRW